MPEREFGPVAYAPDGPMLQRGAVYFWHFVWMGAEEVAYVARLLAFQVSTSGAPHALNIEGEWHPWHQIRQFQLHPDQDTPT